MRSQPGDCRKGNHLPGEMEAIHRQTVNTAALVTRRGNEHNTVICFAFLRHPPSRYGRSGVCIPHSFRGTARIQGACKPKSTTLRGDPKIGSLDRFYVLIDAKRVGIDRMSFVPAHAKRRHLPHRQPFSKNHWIALRLSSPELRAPIFRLMFSRCESMVWRLRCSLLAITPVVSP